MPITVNIPDRGLKLNFPSGMTQDEIKSVIDREVYGKPGLGKMWGAIKQEGVSTAIPESEKVHGLPGLPGGRSTLPQWARGNLRKNLYNSETNYFRNNPNVSGMVSGDNKVILNPYSNLSEQEKQSVVENESVRLFMKKNNIVPDIKVTPGQLNFFKGTPYEQNPDAMKQTIVARVITGDPSIKPTKEQRQYANAFKLTQLESPQTKTTGPHHGVGGSFETPGIPRAAFGGFLSGASSFYGYLDKAAELISKQLGPVKIKDSQGNVQEVQLPKEHIFKALSEFHKPPEGMSPQTLGEKIVSGFTSAPLEIAKFAITPGGPATSMATVGGIEGQANGGGLEGAVKGAVQGAVMGKALGLANKFGKLGSALITGGIFGGSAAIEGGNAQDIASGAFVGAGLGLMGGTNARKTAKKAKLALKDIEGRYRKGKIAKDEMQTVWYGLPDGHPLKQGMGEIIRKVIPPEQPKPKLQPKPQEPIELTEAQVNPSIREKPFEQTPIIGEQPEGKKLILPEDKTALKQALEKPAFERTAQDKIIIAKAKSKFPEELKQVKTEIQTPTETAGARTPMDRLRMQLVGKKGRLKNAKSDTQTAALDADVTEPQVPQAGGKVEAPVSPVEGGEGVRGGGQEDLIKEARKYKSADEFVDSQNKDEITVYRGISQQSQGGGNYWSVDKEWARQFTQTGREEEVRQVGFPKNAIYKGEKLPSAVNEAEIDNTIKEAKSKGYNAIWVDEGQREPNSVFVINPSKAVRVPKSQLTEIWNKANAKQEGTDSDQAASVTPLSASGRSKKTPWKNATRLKPREYQETYPEKTVHEDWNKANSPRYDLEAAGDILRELQKDKPDNGYINEKLSRVGRLIDGEISGKIHPDDSIAAARKHEPEKLDRLISQYEHQPTEGANQLLARDAILDLMKGDAKGAKEKYDRLSRNLDKAVEPIGDKRGWFELGRKVNDALPRESGLKPTYKQWTDTAKKLGISKKDAMQAWNIYSWDSEVPNRPAPKLRKPKPRMIGAPPEKTPEDIAGEKAAEEVNKAIPEAEVTMDGRYNPDAPEGTQYNFTINKKGIETSLPRPDADPEGLRKAVERKLEEYRKAAETEGYTPRQSRTEDGSDIWLVPQQGKPGDYGFGSTVHRSIEDANEQARLNVRRDADAVKREETEKQRVTQKIASKADKEDTDGFADQFNKIKRQKIISILNRTQGFSGKVSRRKDAIRKLVKEGWTVQDVKGERRFIGPDKSFFIEKDITKTGMDYADWLARKAKTPTNQPKLEEYRKAEGEQPKPITTKYTAKLEELKKTEGDNAYFNDEVFALSKTQPQEVIDAYRKQHPKGVGVLFKENSKMGVVISPSAREPGGWQITYFDERGFSGDHASKSEVEAFGEAYKEGYTVPDPARAEKQMASKEFTEGNKRVEQMQKEWAEQSKKFHEDLKKKKAGKAETQVIVKTKDGKTYSLPAKGNTHADVVSKNNIDPDDVVDLGIVDKDGDQIWESETVKAKKKRPAPKASDAKNFRQWVARSGGVSTKDPDWGTEILGIVSTSNGKWGKKRAAGIPRGMLNNKARGIDELVSDAVNDGWLPEGAGEHDFIEALKANIEKPENVESLDYLDKFAKEYYDQYLEQEYGADWENSEEFKRDEAQAKADLETPVGKETLEKVKRDEKPTEEEWQALLDEAEKHKVEEQQNLFGPKQEAPFELKPTEPTPHERIAIGRQKGEIGKPKGSTKAVFPTGKITPGTHGKQQNLFDKLTGQEQTDLESAISQPKKTKKDRLYPKPRTRMVDTGERLYTSGLVVRNVDDAAALFAQVRKQAQEKAIFLSTDKNGRILDVHSYGKGLKAGVQTSPIEAIGKVLGNKDVAEVYFIHNHPSGDLSPSAEDFRLIKVYSKYLKLKKLELKGLIVGARNNKYSTIDKNGNTETRLLRPTIRREPVKLQERRLVGAKPGPLVTSPDNARTYFKQNYPDKNGVLFLNRKNEVSGFVEFPFGEKTRDAAIKIIQAAEEQNAASAVVRVKDLTSLSKERQQFIRDISTALYNGGTAMLDFMDGDKSMIEDKGQVAFKRFVENPGRSVEDLASDKIVYSTTESKPDHPISKGSLQLLTKQITGKWKNAPKITVIEKQSEHPAIAEDKTLIRGAYLEDAKGNQEVVLVAENIASIKKAASTILEEVLGHTGLREGLRSIIGPNGENMFDATMDAVWKSFPEEVQAIADLPAYKIDTSTKDGKREAADEWVSKQIATDTLPKKIWDRIVMMVKSAARKLGFKVNLGLADVKAIARRAIIKGVPEGRREAVNEFAVTKRYSLKDAVKKITDNPNFRKWFGKSKVVDENGEPLVVYHGSGVKNIGIFDKKKAGTVQTSDWGEGIYFTKSRSQADYYRREALVENDPEGDRLWDEYEKKAKELGTRPMYESIELGFGSPKYDELKKYSDKWKAHTEKVRKGTGGEVYPVYLKMENPYLYKYEGITDPYLPEIAKGQGHDGIIIVYDYPKNKNDLVNQIDEIIAFEPTQIKSIYNRGTFDAKNPDIRFSKVPPKSEEAKLKEARDVIKKAKSFKISSKIHDDISWKPKKFDYSREGLDRLVTKLYTKFVMDEYPVVKLAKKAGPDIAKAIENQIRRIRGKSGIVESILNFKDSKVFDNLANKDGITEYAGITKSLKTILAPLATKDSAQDYERLRVAQRDLAFEKYRPDIKGVNGNKARKMVSLLKAKYGEQGFKVLQRISKQHTRFEMEATLRPLRKAGWLSEEAYNRIISKPESEYYASFLRQMDEVERQTVGGGKDPIKRIHGSEKLKIPSTEGTISNIQRTVKLVETLRLNKMVSELGKVKGLESIVKELKPVFRTVKGDYGVYKKGRDKALRVFETKEEADIYSATIPGSIVAKRPGKSFQVQIRPEVKNAIVTAVDGKKTYYEVPRDVYQALDYYSPQEINSIVRLFSIPTRLLRAGATLSAEFIARNPVRDQFSAFVYSKYGYNPFIDFPKGVFNLLKKSKLYDEYKAAGGESAYFLSLDRQTTNLNAKNIMSYKKKGLEKFATLNPIEGLRVLSNWMEKGTRLGAYGKARKKGATPVEAMAESRELTLDFARMGQEKALNQIIAFWNANIQGTDKMVRAFKHKDSRNSAILKSVMGITLPSVILWAINHDNDRYKNLPDWQKNFFWIIPLGKDGPIIRIPKPFELGIIFGSLPERILDYIADKDPDATKSILTAIKDGALPGFIPTAALPAIENITNYSFFRERRLESLGMQNLPPGMRATPYTSQIIKGAGKATNISPIKIENWVRDWTGTLGGATLQLTDLMYPTEAEKPGQKWYEAAPAIKGFIAREPIGYGSKPVEKFYDNLTETTEAYAGLKVLAKAGKRDEAKAFAKDHKKELLYKVYARRVATRLGKYRVAMTAITNDKKLPAQRKREMIDSIKQKMTVLTDNFNKRYEQRR